MNGEAATVGALAATPWLGLAAALGGGLLIGLERERRKGRGASRAAAGIRSFALAALGGGIAQALGQPALVALGALMVATLVAIAFWKSHHPPAGEQVDPGVTTELALFVTYLVGVLAVREPLPGAAVAVVVAGLLAARERLHRFATELLSEGELHDALLLAALALVLLPVVPPEPWPLLGGLAPRTLLGLVVLILLLQAAGHVALRLFGARAGIALSGLFSGFVSSTATIAAMGVRARGEPAQRAASEAGAVLSTAATWLQAMLMLLAVAPAAARALAPAAAAGALVALAFGALRAHGAAAVAPPAAAAHGPLRVREAALLALLLGAVTVGVSWAERTFGALGLYGGTALAALADAHSPVAALGALQAAGALSAEAVRDGALLAVATNAVTRSVTAFAAGGQAYGARVALSLLLSTGAAALAALAADGMFG